MSIRDGVHTLVSNGLNWVDQNLNEFDPFKNGRLYKIRHGQKLTELATMTYSYIILSKDYDSPQIKRILDFLQATASDHRLMDRLMRFPSEFILYCDIYSVLKKLNLEPHTLRDQINKVIDSNYLNVERVPHRVMDVSLTLEYGGFQTEFPSLDNALKTSILSKELNPFILEESSVYALTHVVMFVCGFGTREPGTEINLKKDELETLLPQLLVSFSQEHHWDLVSELLLVWSCLELPFTEVHDSAWKVILDIQNKNGAIPGPEKALLKAYPKHLPKEILRTDFDCLDERISKDAFFAHHYHTTLVSIIAGVNYLSKVEKGRKRYNQSTKSQTLRENKGSNASNPNLHFFNEKIVNSFERANQWLSVIEEKSFALGCDNPFTARCQIMIGKWICIYAIAPSIENLSIPIKQFCAAIASTQATLDFSSSSGVSSILASALVGNRYELQPSIINLLLSTVGLFQTNKNAVIDFRLSETQYLLYSLGLLSSVQALSKAQLIERLKSLSLDSQKQEIDALIDDLFLYSGWGTKPIVDSEEIITLYGQILLGLATHSFRHYDLVSGCNILRALIYLGFDSNKIGNYLEFLLLHQRSEGSFGYYGPEAHIFMNETNSDWTLVDEKIYLPITLSCLITLIEAYNPKWRFYKAIELWNKNQLLLNF